MDGTGTRLCEGLEASLRCPVCKKRLTDAVYMCGSGHTVCDVCTEASTICAQCRAPYTKIPNLLAQSLLSQFDHIKQGLVYLDDCSMKSNSIVHNTVEGKKESESGNEALPGQYRCWITYECGFIGTFSPIIKHFKNTHPLEFEEHLQDNLPYSNSWTMNYAIGNNIDRALNIGGRLFIVHFSINNDEELCAYVIMYTGHSLAFRHLCRIEVECDDEKLSYKKGKVLSAQSSEDIIRQLKLNVLQLTQNKPLYNALKKKIRFKCSITIEKRNDTVNDVKKRTVSSNNIQQFTNTSHKQSMIPNHSVVQPKTNQKIFPKKTEMPINKEIKSSHDSWRKIKRETHAHNQLYPNLGAIGFPPGQHLNVCSRPLPLMENNHSSALVLPSAPVLHERPLPINPYYQEQATGSIHNHISELPEKTRTDDKCVVC